MIQVIACNIKCDQMQWRMRRLSWPQSEWCLRQSVADSRRVHCWFDKIINLSMVRWWHEWLSQRLASLCELRFNIFDIMLWNYAWSRSIRNGIRDSNYLHCNSNHIDYECRRLQLWFCELFYGRTQTMKHCGFARPMPWYFTLIFELIIVLHTCEPIYHGDTN